MNQIISVKTHTRKNGKQRGKQNYICAECGRQFIEITLTFWLFLRR
ncbi:transposase-like zinc-binding domain-containing protein [Calothrix rhizosoleniae]